MVHKADKIAFITGVTGQDGAHLAASLLRDDWRVYGGFRRGSSSNTWRLDELGITKRVTLVEFQLADLRHMLSVFHEIKPHHIYNLAGESHVADSFKYPNVTLDTNTRGVINVLDAARSSAPEAKIFFASSSEIFGNLSGDECSESTPCRPSNPYGVSKLAAQNLVQIYRESYGLSCFSGILFNHEGPLRGRQFVTRKISHNIARLKVSGGEPMELGSLDSARDWGAAKDYVEAMRAMASLRNVEDMVIASGRTATVRNILTMAARSAGFDPIFDGEGLNEVCTDRRTGLRLAQVSDRYFRPRDTEAIKGNATLLENATGWTRKTELSEIVAEMVSADINRRRNGITNV